MLTDTEFRAQATHAWRKSSLSGSNGECVHVAVVGDIVGIIEADDPATSDAPIVRTPLRNFRVFVQGVKNGEFDL